MDHDLWENDGEGGHVWEEMGVFEGSDVWGGNILVSDVLVGHDPYGIHALVTFHEMDHILLEGVLFLGLVTVYDWDQACNDLVVVFCFYQGIFSCGKVETWILAWDD